MLPCLVRQRRSSRRAPNARSGKACGALLVVVSSVAAAWPSASVAASDHESDRATTQTVRVNVAGLSSPPSQQDVTPAGSTSGQETSPDGASVGKRSTSGPGPRGRKDAPRGATGDTPVADQAAPPGAAAASAPANAETDALPAAPGDAAAPPPVTAPAAAPVPDPAGDPAGRAPDPGQVESPAPATKAATGDPQLPAAGRVVANAAPLADPAHAPDDGRTPPRQAPAAPPSASLTPPIAAAAPPAPAAPSPRRERATPWRGRPAAETSLAPPAPGPLDAAPVSGDLLGASTPASPIAAAAGSPAATHGERGTGRPPKPQAVKRGAGGGGGPWGPPMPQPDHSTAATGAGASSSTASAMWCLVLAALLLGAAPCRRPYRFRLVLCGPAGFASPQQRPG